MKSPLQFLKSNKNFVAEISATSKVAIQVEREKAGALSVECSFDRDAEKYHILANYGVTTGPQTLACVLDSDAYDMGVEVFWRITSDTLPTKSFIIQQ